MRTARPAGHGSFRCDARVRRAPPSRSPVRRWMSGWRMPASPSPPLRPRSRRPSGARRRIAQGVRASLRPLPDTTSSRFGAAGRCWRDHRWGDPACGLRGRRAEVRPGAAAYGISSPSRGPPGCPGAFVSSSWRMTNRCGWPCRLCTAAAARESAGASGGARSGSPASWPGRSMLRCSSCSAC